MKFKIGIEEFRAALTEVKDTIGSEKLSREGLRLFADAKGRVRLTTNDGSYATDTWVDADVEQAGEIILVAKIFYQYFTKLEGKEVEMSLVEPTKLQVKTKRGKQVFMALADDRFEPVIELVPDHEVDVAGRTFKQMVNGVSFATDAKGSKGQPELEGINIISNGKVTEFVTTDRLTIASIKKKLSLPKLSLIVGGKSLTRLARQIRDDEKVSLIIYPRGVLGLRYKDTTHFSPLFQGKFPDTSRVLKSVAGQDDTRTYAAVDKVELIALLERAELLCESTAYMKLDGMKLSIKGNSSYAQFDEFMFANVEGSPVEVRFSIRALIDIVKNVQDDSVEIGLEKGKSIVCTPDSKLNQVCVLAAMG